MCNSYLQWNTASQELACCLLSPAVFYAYCIFYGIYIGPANPEPYAKCDEGWFCPTNNTVSQPAGNRCLPGHQCPQGSALQMPCASGYYQPLPEQGECLLCPAGTCLPTILFMTWSPVGFIRGCLSTNPWSTIDFVDERSPYGESGRTLNEYLRSILVRWHVLPHDFHSSSLRELSRKDSVDEHPCINPASAVHTC